jgi:hypothetical protein
VIKWGVCWFLREKRKKKEEEMRKKERGAVARL